MKVPGLEDHKGAVAIIVGATMITLVCFAALAVEAAHLYLARNELQNAADAGALAGTAALYRATNGLSVDPNASQIAYDTATTNQSEGSPAEVNWTTGQNDEDDVDVQRGHWTWANPSADPPYNVDTSSFTPNSSLDAINISLYTTDQLNVMNNNINAVRVTARREATPIISFLAGIFGYTDFKLSATATAYIGFTNGKSISIGYPIAICQSSLTDSDRCNVGRMFNSNIDTARWTNMDSPDNSFDANDLKELIDCDQGEPELYLEEPVISTTEGQVDGSFRELDCIWRSDSTGLNLHTQINGSGNPDGIPDYRDGEGIPDQPWSMKLPVIDCSESPTYGEVVSAVDVKVLHIAPKDNIDEAPLIMADPREDTPDYWPTLEEINDVNEKISAAGNPGDFFSNNPKDPNDDYASMMRWNSFVNRFGLVDENGDLALVDPDQGKDGYVMKTIYFLPECKISEGDGKPGFINFGIRSRDAVLVE